MRSWRHACATPLNVMGETILVCWMVIFRTRAETNTVQTSRPPEPISAITLQSTGGYKLIGCVLLGLRTLERSKTDDGQCHEKDHKQHARCIDDVAKVQPHTENLVHDAGTCVDMNTVMDVGGLHLRNHHGFLTVWTA